MVIKLWDDHTERWHDETGGFFQGSLGITSRPSSPGAERDAYAEPERCPRWIAIENGHRNSGFSH